MKHEMLLYNENFNSHFSGLLLECLLYMNLQRLGKY